MKFLIELRSQLPNMNVPALFLCGTGDKLSPPELTELPYKEIGSSFTKVNSFILQEVKTKH